MFRDLVAILVMAIIAASAYFSGRSFLLPLGLLLGYIAAVILRERQRANQREFVLQLKSHRKELRSGGAVAVDNHLLRYDTILTRYHFTVGGLITSVTIPSNYQEFSKDNTNTPLLYSFYSLIFGWWSLPWGPLHTLAHIANNLRGGELVPVSILVDEPFIKKYLAQQEHYSHLLANAHKEPKQERLRESVRKGATGRGSASGKLFEKRTKLQQGPNLKERLELLNNPITPGQTMIKNLQTQTRENIDSLKDTILQTLSKPKEVPTDT